MKQKLLLLILFGICLPYMLFSQHEGHSAAPDIVTGVEPQPLLAQAIRLSEALTFLGSSLSDKDQKLLKALQHQRLSPEITSSVQRILDPYCLAMVNINPEARVKVARGPAKAKLTQGGWTSFLVKVNNDAAVTAQLEVQSPNSAPALHISTFQPRVMEKHIITEGQEAQRFLEMQMYRNRPLLPNLSGLKLEYAVLQIYSKDAGQREAEMGFNIGQGTQDIGFRNTINILFEIRPSVKVALNVKDEDGSPTMASFTITDGIERIVGDTVKDVSSIDYRLTKAKFEYSVLSKELKGIYPLPSRRVAAYDQYPDFFFQPQIYRSPFPGKIQCHFYAWP
jgi:hypothetical protein